MERSITLKQRISILKGQLDQEYSTFEPDYKALSENILPRRSRFFQSDVNRGGSRNNKIYDSTATLSVRTAQSGMTAGITSPARPWFNLTFQNSDIAKSPAVKDWLSVVEDRMKAVFLKSNLYNALPTLYGDLLVFATGALFMEEDLESVVNFIILPVGSYRIANDEKLRVRVFMREFRMTVREILEKFCQKNPDGSYILDNVSVAIKDAYANGNLETWIDVNHTIMPNPDYAQDDPRSHKKKFISVYMEKSCVNDKGQDIYLKKSGYDYFPVLAPRWQTTGEDVYGTQCPGMLALGDIKQLQLGEKRAAQAIEKMINPPMVGPVSLKNQQASILPGDITYVDESKGGFRSAHEVRFDLSALEAKQGQIRNRIQRAFFEDLFLMLANSDRRQITAREIEERYEEKLLALGPVLEQLNQDLLDPLIDNTFAIMLERDLIPEAPEEIQGEELKIEYVSIMAQAQKLAGIGAIDRFLGAIGNAASIYPEVLKKVDPNHYVDIYADLTGVPPKLVRSNEEVQKIAEEEAAAAMQAQAAEQAQMAISSAKDLSQINTSEDSALSELMQASEAGGLV